MALYPKIDNESILLDMDCKRLLKRTSRQRIINEVKLDNNYINYCDNDNNSKNNNKSLLEIVLFILGCNIK